jgi:SAM-dependent methyltransferase
MRFGAVAENPVEWVVKRLNLAPQPLLDTQMAYTLARVIMEGVRIGAFDALRDGPGSTEHVARVCGTDPEATGKLLFALAGAGYLKGVDGGYKLTRVSRKWLLADSKGSLREKLLLQFVEWEFVGRSGEYLSSGEPLELHGGLLDDAGQEAYQRGMRSMARALSWELIRRFPVPGGARDMLDIGGSHGYYSAELCRRNDGLRATVLDLPEAVEHAAPLLAEEGLGDRVVHRAGDALTDDLGEAAYDLVLVSQLVHHFSAEQNRELARRIARALRPGGVYVIFDAFRPHSASDAGQLGALMEFYFALTSSSGTWSPAEMAAWQRDAGLAPGDAIHLRTAPGAGLAPATKPG